jgi:hypothetical protein
VVNRLAGKHARGPVLEWMEIRKPGRRHRRRLRRPTASRPRPILDWPGLCDLSVPSLSIARTTQSTLSSLLPLLYFQISLPIAPLPHRVGFTHAADPPVQSCPATTRPASFPSPRPLPASRSQLEPDRRPYHPLETKQKRKN